MEILSPNDWNAIVDYDAWDDPFVPNDALGLHHGGGSDYAAHRTPYSQAKEIQQLQQWEGYHLYSKGWRGLAYGFAIGQTGTIYRIRGFNRYGAHTGDLDGDGIANNDEVIPILFVGSGHHAELSPAAKRALVFLRQMLEENAGTTLTLYGHQELRGTVTSCPGPKLMAYITDHRELEETMTPEQEAKLDRVLELVDNLPRATMYEVHGRAVDDPINDDNPRFVTFVRRIYLKVNQILEVLREQGSGTDQVARRSATSAHERIDSIGRAATE